MCIAAWVWQAHPVYPLLLLLNRDEYHDRPTDPVGWWGEGEKKVLGGRDRLAGGTWMGCSREGRVAFLTNVRETGSLTNAKTRGDLPLRFLQSSKTPPDFAEEIVEEADQYNGFNLIIADLCLEVMFYISNRPKGQPAYFQMVPPGVHVLSNAELDAPWYKAERLRKTFKELLECHGHEVVAKVMVEKLMRDTTKAPKECLPKTGKDPEWESELSSIFIETGSRRGLYGTRSMIALSVKTNGDVSLYERYLEDAVWKEHTVQYSIEKEK